jgi:N-methylhydantoinase A
MMDPMIRIGIDIGGTFTDFAVWSGAETFDKILAHKSPSTPPDFAEGVKNGLRDILPNLSRRPGEPILVVHGMTVGTNTVIERNGAALSLLVTEGFRDILRLGRLRVLKPFDLFSQRSTPLIARSDVHEVPERIAADGSIVTALDTEACVAAARKARKAGVATLVVCFLHSHTNPEHEIAARVAILAAEPDMDVVLSHEVWPQEGEYERATLAVLNAYVKPVMSAYLAEVEDFLAKELPEARLFVAKSNGGMMAASEARVFPVHTLLSGPAAGVTATQFLGRLTGRDNLLTMDMGGTSTDMSLVRGGRSMTSTNSEIGEFPLTLPVTTIEAMGAGGGSIAWTDGEVLRVGPRSSGARPGPACYGHGGTLPTMSDAYLLCGYLGDALLGGSLVLDRGAAGRAFEPLAESLGITVEKSAEHAVTVATATMIGRALPFLARLGVDPQQLTLVLFGGAGSIHGPLLAAEMGINEVLIPPTASVFCAAGCLVADIIHDTVRSVRRAASTEALFNELQVEAHGWLDGQIDPAWLTGREIQRFAAMRYAGQSFDIDVTIPEGGDQAAAVEAFHDEHERLYAHCDRTASVQFVGLRVRIIGHLPNPGGKVGTAVVDRAEPPVKERRRLSFEGQMVESVPVYLRRDLAGGAEVVGPAVIEQDDTTILLPPLFTAKAGPVGELVLRKG